jgi:hypothetical protein
MNYVLTLFLSARRNIGNSPSGDDIADKRSLKRF